MKRKIAAIFADVLGLDKIGIDQAFFDLGGHSLLSLRLFAQIEEQMGHRLPLATIFEGPTVARLAAAVRRSNDA